MSRTITALAGALALASAVGIAQTRRMASPPGTSTAEVTGRYNERDVYVGGKWIELRYGRPVKRGRDLFGPPDFAEALNDGAPVWRAGANVSTRLVTELPLVINGKRLAPGEHTLFIELKRNDWTLIVSSWPAQTTYDDKNKQALWGAYDYTPDRDVVRSSMHLESLSHSFEQLAWEFLDMTDTGGRLALIWDRTMAWVPFDFLK
jgi:hypothetical protein